MTVSLNAWATPDQNALRRPVVSLAQLLVASFGHHGTVWCDTCGMRCYTAVLLLCMAASLGLMLGQWQLMCCPAPTLGAAWFFGLPLFFGLLGYAMWRRRGTASVALCATTYVFALRIMTAPCPGLPSAHAELGTETLWQVSVRSAPVQAYPPGPKQGARVTLNLMAQQRHNSWYPERGSVAVVLWQGAMVARGDVLLLRMVVRPLRDVAAPWDESLHQSMRRRGISMQALVCGPHAHKGRASWLLSACDGARQRAAARLHHLMPRRQAGVAAALALGDTEAIDVADRDAWSDAGIAHLLAVSGLHVGLVARAVMAALWGALALFPNLAEHWSLRRISSVSALPFVWGYALFTGGAVSALRAALMLTVVLGSHALGYGPARTAHSLGAAFLLLALWDPWAIFTAGFWLSFVSVACLVASLWIAPSPHQAARNPSFCKKLQHNVQTALATGLVAALGTAPLCGLFFGRMSLVAPLSNLVAVPLASLLATPLAILVTVLCGFVSQNNGLLNAMGRLCDAVLSSLHGIAWAAGRLSFAAVQAGPQAYGVSAAACAAMFLLWLRGWCRHHGFAPISAIFPSPRLRFVAAALCVACVGGAAVALSLPNHPYNKLTLWHLDVAQGDSTLVGLPQGGWVLVDGGGASYPGQPDPGRWAVARALTALKITKLYAVVLTHPHPDHMNGLAYVLERWPTQHFFRSEEAQADPFVQALDKRVAARGGVPSLPPPEWHCQDTHLRFFSPLRGQAASTNDHSIVVELTYKNRRALLMGDAEHRAELSLQASLRPIDVLKVGHHGSRTSSSEEFLAKVQPYIAVISCGANNRFGHPHDKALTALTRSGARMLRTDLQGSIMLQTDGHRPFAWASRGTRWALVPLAGEGR